MVQAAASTTVIVVVVVAVESWLAILSRAAGAEAQGLFRNTEEGEHPPLETIMRRMVRTLVCVRLSAQVCMCVCVYAPTSCMASS
jgi:hypothetical protein